MDLCYDDQAHLFQKILFNYNLLELNYNLPELNNNFLELNNKFFLLNNLSLLNNCFAAFDFVNSCHD